MDFEEHAAKPLLAAAGIAVPLGRYAETADEAAAAAQELGAVIVKAQVASGKRGLAGGIRPADDVEATRQAAAEILAMEIGGLPVNGVLVEQRVAIASEFYAAVLNDAASKGPLLMVSTMGGMDVEGAAAEAPDSFARLEIDIRYGPDAGAIAEMLSGIGADPALADTFLKLYDVYRGSDAELVEINPLVLTEAGAVMALDCKFVLDDSAVPRQGDLAVRGAPAPATALERKARELELKFIELDGAIGVVANGAGLTMTTMDVITFQGGRPANFLEIGGDAYTKGTAALELALSNPKVKCLVVNFCGAFARTDVMTEGLLAAWTALKPRLPVFFSIHGTGDEEARQMVRDQLGLEPYATMDEAIAAAIEAAS